MKRGHTFANIRHLDINLDAWVEYEEAEDVEEDMEEDVEDGEDGDDEEDEARKLRVRLGDLVNVVSKLQLESLTVRFGDESILLDVLRGLAPMPTLRSLRLHYKSPRFVSNFICVNMLHISH